jgi:RND family efflux transporter MFP subunit
LKRNLVCVLLALLALPGPLEAWSAVPVVAVRADVSALAHEVDLTGTVTSPRVSALSAAVGGLVVAIAVEEGDRVRKGDLLVTLDSELQAIAVERARAALAQAEAELADAGRRYAEVQRLAERQGISESQVRSLEAEVAIDGAMRDRLAAEVREQQVLLARHRVSAPFAGVVSRKLGEIGAWVQPGDSVLELSATDALRIDLQVPQQYYAQVAATGLRVAVTLDTAPDATWRAQRTLLVPVGDPDARTFLLRVYLADDAPLVAGMSAHAHLTFDAGIQGVLVPRDALLRHPDGRTTVWVVEPSGDGSIASERRVTLGAAMGGNVHVREGIAPGEWIVLRGNESLQEGARVELTSMTGATGT